MLQFCRNFPGNQKKQIQNFLSILSSLDTLTLFACNAEFEAYGKLEIQLQLEHDYDKPTNRYHE